VLVLRCDRNNEFKMRGGEFNLPFRELIRYAVVGVILNMTGYIAYLLLTHFLLSPIIAMSVLYPMSILLAYFSHRKHTFKSNPLSTYRKHFFLFLLIYLIGYVLNFISLYFFHGKLGFPHEIVQIATIFIVAIILYLLFKSYVFRSSHSRIYHG
jgi:putative flippase GtrA